MALTSKQIIGEFADAVVAAIESQKGALEPVIATAEAEVTAGLTNLLKNLPKPSGIQGALVAPLEAAFAQAAESYAKEAVAKYGPDIVFALLDAQLKAWAKEIGG